MLEVSRKVSSLLTSLRHPLPGLIKWPHERSPIDWTTMHNETVPVGWVTCLLKLTPQIETLCHKGAKNIVITLSLSLFFSLALFPFSFLILGARTPCDGQPGSEYWLRTWILEPCLLYLHHSTSAQQIAAPTLQQSEHHLAFIKPFTR